MIYLDEQEYARFTSIVNTNFKKFSKGGFYTIPFDNKYISFEVIGFDVYRIIEVGEVNEQDN